MIFCVLHKKCYGLVPDTFAFIVFVARNVCPKNLLHGEEIRPVAPWNKWGSGVGFLTHAHIHWAYISESVGGPLSPQSLISIA